MSENNMDQATGANRTEGSSVRWDELPTKELSNLSVVNQPPTPRTAAMPDIPFPDSALHGDSVPAKGDKVSRAGLRKLPKVLLASVKGSMTACEIGQYLHRIVQGCDPSLGGMIRQMVEDNKPYHEIALHTLWFLDLRDDEGKPLFVSVKHGDRDLRPYPDATPDHSVYGRGECPFSYENPETGSKIHCPKPRRFAPDTDLVGILERACSRGDGEDQEGGVDGGDDDGEYETNVASQLTYEAHQARQVVIGKGKGKQQ